MKIKNIFSRLPAARKKEVFHTLAKTRSFRIERIVSRGQATLEGAWFCEKTAEWVIVLQGKAALVFKDKKKKYVLSPGDYVLIPAKTPHRVAWTHPRQKTVWLAVYER